MAAKTPRLYLEHIKEAIAIVERRVTGRTLADLAADDVLRDAIERRIEMISEASRRLPEDMKARHPEVPWHNVAGIGNVRRRLIRRAAGDLRPALGFLPPPRLCCERAMGTQRRTSGRGGIR